jgi:hypothetical protein
METTQLLARTQEDTNLFNDFYGLLDRGLRTGDNTDVFDWQERYMNVELVLHDFPEIGDTRTVTPGDLRARLGCSTIFYFNDPKAVEGCQARQFKLGPASIGRIGLVLATPDDTEVHESKLQ